MYILRIILQLCLTFFDLLIIYFLFAIIGMYWVRNHDESNNLSGIPLIIHGDGFHTELYLPVEDSILHHNWFSFLKDSLIFEKHGHNKYVNFGWAEEDWSIAGSQEKTHILMAFETLLWPWNNSIMHVQMMDTTHALKNPFTERRMLTVPQYQKLVKFIKGGFVIKNERPVIRSYQGYYGYDYFFSSRRKYNAFNTCNQWTADALDAAYIRNPTFAPFGWAIAYQTKK